MKYSGEISIIALLQAIYEVLTEIRDELKKK